MGVRPTFGTGRGVLVEAYLLDRDVDLYGQVLRVEFLKRLRGERRFAAVDALVEQMHQRRRTQARARMPVASLIGRMTLTSERKQELVQQFGRQRGRHRQGPRSRSR